jgi:hypothetical protein
MAELSIKFWVNFELRFVSFFKFKISLKATRSSPSHTFKSVQLYLIPLPVDSRFEFETKD